ncbi:MAG: SUF system NifU family Fe-S cluster assembly protein [Chloroflexota bacterium]|nr:SUF system NifU family Fe-S cluster assembly protein [Chloroflexota bacterium]
MEDFYREYILDHYRNPRNRGTLEAPDITYEDSNPLCGDEIKIDLSVKDGVVEDVKFSGRGCAISQASVSMLTEMIEGKSLGEVKQISKEDILELIGIPLTPVRLKCALLGLKVLKGGVYGIQGLDDEDL